MEEKSSDKKYFHPPLVMGVTAALTQIFHDGKYADKVLEKLFKANPTWGSRDRGIIAECTYDLVRYWRFYSFLNALENETDEASLFKRIAAWSKVHDLLLPRKFQDGIPTEEEWKSRWEEAQSKRAIRESIPDWMDEYCSKAVGKRWEKELTVMNKPAPLVLRANTLKTTRDALETALNEKGFETSPHPLNDNGLFCGKKGKIFFTDEFQKGLFEVQDSGSQLIAPFLDVKPGMKVIDACAGGGGKTLHLAALMNNKGQIIAMDTAAWKLDEMKKRARRNGAFNIEPRIIENNKTIKRLHQKADRLLIDAPCSGLGVFRRNPDAKWKLTQAAIEELIVKQKEILEGYSKMVKPGGKMVYATCSVLPAENAQQVENFLKNNPDWKLEEERMIWPSEHDSDGFYMARMVVKG